MHGMHGIHGMHGTHGMHGMHGTMHACMYACMHLFMYACMHACIYVFMSYGPTVVDLIVWIWTSTEIQRQEPMAFVHRSIHLQGMNSDRLWWFEVDSDDILNFQQHWGPGAFKIKIHCFCTKILWTNRDISQRYSVTYNALCLGNLQLLWRCTDAPCSTPPY